MHSKSGLYPHFHPLRRHPSEDRIRKVNLIILDINFDDVLMNDQLFQMKIFTEEQTDSWFDYITSGINDIYLFIPNIISNILFQSICEYSQIKSIYMLCRDQQYQNYSNSTSKLRGIFNDFDTMFKQFQDDMNQLKNQYYSEQITFQIIDGKSEEFLWWKFFHQILEHIQPTDIAKEEFMAFFREFFRANQYIRTVIEDFKSNYVSDKVIHLYTQPILFYQLINQTLRAKNNFNNIFKIRLILSDLISGLKTEHSTYNSRSDSFIVYHGKMMKLEEIQQLKSAEGYFICFNHFLSTTKKRETAYGFAQCSLDSRCSEHVLFIIKRDLSDTNSGTTLFANISKHSYFCEEEVLFSIYSIFQVLSVQPDADNLYQIHLKFVDNPWDTVSDQRHILNLYTDPIFIRNPPKENKQSIGFQVLLDMILRLKQTEYAKQELFEFARSKYQRDPTQLEKIDNCKRNYQSEDAAKWYTEDSFLYRLLNELIDTEPIECIVKMRYFIHDLHYQLHQLQTQLIQSLNGQTNLTVYRGRMMKFNRLKQFSESIGGLFTINTFLSATQNERFAIALSGGGKTTNPDEVSVILEMLIDTNIRSIPFAKIKDMMEHDEEILFSIGSIFRIENVYERPNRIYYVKLKMEHIERELWNKLTAHLD